MLGGQTSWGCACRQRSAAVALVAALAGCGGGDNGNVTAPPTPAPTPPPPVVVAQGSGRAVAVNRALYRDFETTAAGTLDATVDYTFSSSVVLLWLSKGNCSPDQAQALQCNYIATSFTGSQPRRLSATGTTPGAYTLIVGNLGPQEEAVSYQVVLTPSASTGFPLRAAGRSGVGLERIEGLPKAEAVP